MKKIVLSLLLSGLVISGFAQTYKEKLESQQKRIQMKLNNQQKRVDLQFGNQIRRMFVHMELEQPENRPEIPEPSVPQVYQPSMRVPTKRPGTQSRSAIFCSHHSIR